MESKIGKNVRWEEIMELSYKEIRAQICDVCHKMWQLGWVASNDGNVSVKLSDGTFLATPTGVSKKYGNTGNDRAYK